MTVQQLVKSVKNRKQFAGQCKVSESMLSLIANGWRRPSLDLAKRLGKATGMTLDAAVYVDSKEFHFSRGAK